MRVESRIRVYLNERCLPRFASRIPIRIMLCCLCGSLNRILYLWAGRIANIKLQVNAGDEKIYTLVQEGQPWRQLCCWRRQNRNCGSPRSLQWWTPKHPQKSCSVGVFPVFRFKIPPHLVLVRPPLQHKVEFLPFTAAQVELPQGWGPIHCRRSSPKLLESSHSSENRLPMTILSIMFIAMFQNQPCHVDLPDIVSSVIRPVPLMFCSFLGVHHIHSSSRPWPLNLGLSRKTQSSGLRAAQGSHTLLFLSIIF